MEKMNKRGFICQPALVTFLLRRKFCLFFIGFHPLACIDKRFYPRSDLVAVYAVCGVATILPGEDSTFQVGHHGQMTSVGTCQSGYGLIRTVGVGRLFVVLVFQHNVVFVLMVRQREFAFAVGHPDTRQSCRNNNVHLHPCLLYTSRCV